MLNRGDERWIVSDNKFSLIKFVISWIVQMITSLTENNSSEKMINQTQLADVMREWKCGKHSTLMSFRIAEFNIKWLFYDEVTRLDIFIDQYFNFYRWWVHVCFFEIFIFNQNNWNVEVHSNNRELNGTECKKIIAYDNHFHIHTKIYSRVIRIRN